jgi:hypothetical protein
MTGKIMFKNKDNKFFFFISKLLFSALLTVLSANTYNDFSNDDMVLRSSVFIGITPFKKLKNRAHMTST